MTPTNILKAKAVDQSNLGDPSSNSACTCNAHKREGVQHYSKVSYRSSIVTLETRLRWVSNLTRITKAAIFGIKYCQIILRETNFFCQMVESQLQTNSSGYNIGWPRAIIMEAQGSQLTSVRETKFVMVQCFIPEHWGRFDCKNPRAPLPRIPVI